MNAYVITGPESLIHAAFKETFEALGSGALLANTGAGPYNSLFFNCAGSYWLSVGINNLNFQHHYALPADWDKFMGIFTELKKPKLPEYVRHNESGKVYRVIGSSGALSVYGKQYAMSFDFCTSITEQEFIEGGLKELAEAGYVKGASITVETTDPSCKGEKVIKSVGFYDGRGSSHHVHEQYKKAGFAFLISSSSYAMHVGQCTLVHTLPVTSQGIPYLRQGQQVFYGPSGNDGVLTLGTLRHLLRQGVTELVTKAGRLTHADLERFIK